MKRFTAPSNLKACYVFTIIRSDVWMFGVTVIEMLTGQEPYPVILNSFITYKKDLDPIQAASNVMHKGLRPPIPENVPPKLAILLDKVIEIFLLLKFLVFPTGL
jgi:hypothetical protein